MNERRPGRGDTAVWALGALCGAVTAAIGLIIVHLLINGSRHGTALLFPVIVLGIVGVAAAVWLGTTVRPGDRAELSGVSWQSFVLTAALFVAASILYAATSNAGEWAGAVMLLVAVPGLLLTSAIWVLVAAAVQAGVRRMLRPPGDQSGGGEEEGAAP